MTLSVINVINYKKIANLIRSKSKTKVTEILRRQTTSGALLALGILSMGVLSTSSEWFRASFPSYKDLNFFIAWQGLFLMSFSLMVPLTTFLNLLKGGKFHLMIMTGLCSLSILVSVIFGYSQLPMSTFYAVVNTLLFLSTLVMLVKVYSELKQWQ